MSACAAKINEYSHYRTPLTRLALAATPLLFFPRLLLFLASTGEFERRTALTPLESFFSLQTGILLVALAFALILNVRSSRISF